MEARTARPDRAATPGALAGLLRPILAFRLRYLPLLMVYFAYGALGIIDVARDMWIKESLSLTAVELAGIGVWLTLPWTIKMVFGELVDTVPIFGSQRKAYILIGATFIAGGLVVLAGSAGRWIAFACPDGLYILGAMLMVIGTVIQDVVADAMSTEIVPRFDDAGRLRPEEELRAELGMVQVLGRLALSFGILAVAGASGWLASFLARETVFLLGLVMPVISVTGVLLIRSETAERRPIDWRILGGGLAFGCAVLALAFSKIPFGQEFIFVISMAVICAMLVFVTRDLDRKTRRAIMFTSIVIFAFRATPAVGDGYFWWTLDVLKFDEAFYGALRQTSAVLGIRRAVGVQQAVNGIFRQWGSALARAGGRIPLAPKYRIVLWPASLDAGEFRFRCAGDRCDRYRGFIAICTAEHDPAAHIDCVLCSAGSPRQLVCVDGFPHEPGAGGGTAADQVPQPAVCHRARK